LVKSLLPSLAGRFQVRLYEFGKEPVRIQKADQLTATEPATRIGDTLENLLAESSSLPLGAVVLLSDGADNAGGIDLQTISAIRRQRTPVHTVGVRPAHPPLTAEVTLQTYGLSGAKTRLSIRDGAKTLASKEIELKSDGVLQTESLVFDC